MGTEPPPQWSDPNALAGFSSDINYTEQQVSAFLRKEAGLSVSAIEQLGVGTDSVAFLVNQTWIFKFTRRREAIPYASAESYVLERLARESFPIAVPRVKYAGFIRREWPYIGYRVIPGVPGYRSGLDRRQRTQTGVLLADFLRALHAVEPAAQDRQALPEDRFGHDDLDDWIDEIESRIKGLVNAGVVQDPSDRLSIISAARGCRLDNRVSIVHRDLTAKNMLFTDSLKGIVDWADASLGHPAIDLEIPYLLLPAESRGAFWERYGDVPSAWRVLARLRALYRTGFWISSPSYRDDSAFHEEARQALQFVLEGP